MTSTVHIFITMLSTMRSPRYTNVVQHMPSSAPDISLDNAPLRCDVTRVIDMRTHTWRVWTPAL